MLRPLAFVGALAALGFFALPVRHASAGWWDDLDKGESVTLSDLCAEPTRWRDKIVTFACIFNERAEIYSPYFTSFNAEKYENVTAWLDGSPLWEPDAFQRDDFPFLYLPRNHTQRAELFRLPSFTRIEITGKVKDVYRSRPWIEIQAFRVTAATLGRAVVHYVKDGDGYAAQGNYVQAEANYRGALAEIKLADVYRMRVEKRLASVLRSAGKDLEARKVEGPTPILGAKGAPPAGSRGGTGLPDARSPGSSGVPAAPPDELTGDLPGEPVGAPVRRPAPPVVEAPYAEPTHTDPGFRPVAPPPRGSVALPSEITSDLPGNTSDAGPARVPPTYVPPTYVPPTYVPPTSLPPPSLPESVSTPPPPVVPSSPPPEPPPPVPAAPAPAVPAPEPSAPPAPPAPPTPPAREPRLSGVK